VATLDNHDGRKGAHPPDATALQPGTRSRGDASLFPLSPGVPVSARTPIGPQGFLDDIGTHIHCRIDGCLQPCQGLRKDNVVALWLDTDGSGMFHSFPWNGGINSRNLPYGPRSVPEGSLLCHQRCPNGIYDVLSLQPEPSDPAHGTKGLQDLPRHYPHGVPVPRRA